MGEEWRRDWHPEKIKSKSSDDSVLIIGGGPAGLEATLSLARRGYSVAIADSEKELGGRINMESKLPGMTSYKRVVDYRVNQINQLNNVDVLLVQDGTDAFMTEYGNVLTGSNTLINFSADISGDDVRLRATVPSGISILE